MAHGDRRISLSNEEKELIEASVKTIQTVLRKHEIDIRALVGTVTEVDLNSTRSAVDVRFVEEGALAGPMNMVAFD
jgi:hypothetical protein